jgi:hypothetical protein
MSIFSPFVRDIAGFKDLKGICFAVTVLTLKCKKKREVFVTPCIPLLDTHGAFFAIFFMSTLNIRVH